MSEAPDGPFQPWPWLFSGRPARLAIPTPRPSVLDEPGFEAFLVNALRRHASAAGPRGETIGKGCE